MNEFLAIGLTILVVAIAAYLIIKKVDSKMVFLFLGIATLLLITIITQESIAGDATTGNMFLDVFDVFRLKLKSTVSGVGITLMTVAGYVMLMNHMKASNVLAAAAGKVLVKLKSPYVVLSAVFVLGSILKVFITSQISLGLLFMATLFPILTQLGVSRLSAAAIMVTIGMLDMGPNDSSAIFGANEVMKVTPMEYFLNYEILVGMCIVGVLAIVYPLYFKYLDKKENGGVDPVQAGEIKTFSPRDYGVPLFYGFFPVIPLLLVVVFSFIPSIKMDIITANVIGFIIVFLIDLAVKRDVEVVSKNLQQVFIWMGNYFTNIVMIIVSAGVFADAIKKLGGIDIIAQKCSQLTGASLIAVIALSVIVFGTALLTGSGNASWFAFGPLTPGIAETLGTQTATFAVPMHLGSGIGRTLSPFCGGVIAISGVAEVDIYKLIKRNMLPLTVAYIVNIIAYYIIFI